MSIKTLKRATGEDLKAGWTTDFKLLQQIQKIVFDGNFWSVSVEAIEDILIALKDLGYVEFEKEKEDK